MPYMYVPDNQMNGWAAGGQAVPDRLTQLRQGQYQQAQQPAAAQTGGGINWVQGEVGAKAYRVLPGCMAWLMDSEEQVFYIKSADASGVPLPLRIFDYQERLQGGTAPQGTRCAQGQDYVTREEFNALAARIAALTEKEETNGEPLI